MPRVTNGSLPESRFVRCKLKTVLQLLQRIDSSGLVNGRLQNGLRDGALASATFQR
jgi:hypothetical protein